MKKIMLTVFCAAFAASLLAPPFAAASPAASVDYCRAYAKKWADRKMGPKAAENALLMGATGGLAGKPIDGKRKFTGFGLGGAFIGLAVSNDKRMKYYKHYYNRCMTRA